MPICRSIVSAVLWLLTTAAITIASPDQAAGTWRGEVKLPGQPLRVVVKLEAAAAELRGTIDIPQQGAADLPLEEITIDQSKIRFRIAGIPGAPTFDGRLKNNQIDGTFTQAGQRFPFELHRKEGEATPVRRPQDPVPPFPYTSTDVQIPSGRITLAGTLTTPAGKGPFPAAILLSGSGPQNRDSELFDHRPFLVLADHLTRAGIAVLRFDDRGVGESGGDYAAALKEDFIADAAACVRFLRGRDDIDAVGLLGHSEGADIAAAAAASRTRVDFVVLLAGPGVPGHELMIEQNRRVALSTGSNKEQADEIAERARQLFDAAMAGAPEDRLADLMRALAEAQTGQPLPPGADAQLQPQLESLRSPRFLEMLRHDPREDLKKVRAPVLAVTGSNDVQVSATQNLPAIAEALKEGGNTNVTSRELPGLNHLLQPAPGGGGVHEYGTITQTIDPAALDLVRDWILQQTASRDR